MNVLDKLTSREMEIAVLVSEGKKTKEIAVIQGTSSQVVRNRIRSIFDKLGCWNRLELALLVWSLQEKKVAP